MRELRHCRHCLGGDCPGDCLFGGTGRCIHGWNDKSARQLKPRRLLSRRWWHQVFWGTK